MSVVELEVSDSEQEVREEEAVGTVSLYEFTGPSPYNDDRSSTLKLELQSDGSAWACPVDEVHIFEEGDIRSLITILGDHLGFQMDLDQQEWLEEQLILSEQRLKIAMDMLLEKGSPDDLAKAAGSSG